MLNMRLVRPGGAGRRQRRCASSTGIAPTRRRRPPRSARSRARRRWPPRPRCAERAPLLAEAARHVGHAAIRNRARSAAASPTPIPPRSCPPALVALDARVHDHGPARRARDRGGRVLPRPARHRARAGRDPDRDRACPRSRRAGGSPRSRGGPGTSRWPGSRPSCASGAPSRCPLPLRERREVRWWASASAIGRSGSRRAERLLAGAPLDAATRGPGGRGGGPRLRSAERRARLRASIAATWPPCSPSAPCSRRSPRASQAGVRR